MLPHRQLGQRPITGSVTPVWFARLLHFPVSSKLLESKALPLGWLLDPDKSESFTNRVLARLIQAEAHEVDPWTRDDLRIAWIATLYASEGNPQPLIDATYAVLGLHPDKVWPAILRNREAMLGPESIPHNKKQPMAANRDGDAPQKTCAYGAVNDSKLAETSTPQRAEVEAARIVDTGSSCRTETKREARRIRTSEFGLHDAPPMGVAAPMAKKPCASVRDVRERKTA